MTPFANLSSTPAIERALKAISDRMAKASPAFLRSSERASELRCEVEGV